MIEVVFLGTSCVCPTRERGHPALWLRYEKDQFLFDCGEGTQRQMKIAGINPMKINRVFLSHLHGDHVFGLGPLFTSLSFLGKKGALEIYGPKDSERVVDHIVKSCYMDKPDYEIIVKECGEEKIVETKDYEIASFPLKHSIPSLGFLFKEHDRKKFNREKALKLGIPESRLWSRLQRGETVEHEGKTFKPQQVLEQGRSGKRIVYASDTVICDKTKKYAWEADLLIHEATFSDKEKNKAARYKHTTAKQAAKLAKEIGVKKLVLTHFSQRYTDVSEIEKEAKKEFKNTVLAKDFMKIEV